MPSAQDRDGARRAWDYVTSGVNGAKAELADLREPFVQALDKGEPLTDIETQLEDRLAEAEWDWPWFEEWYQKFDSWRMFPAMWPQLVPPVDEENPYSPEELAAYRKAGIAPVIAHTAAMIFFRDRHLGKAHAHMHYRLSHKGDPAEMKASEEFAEAIKNGDNSKMPPFFPGDRTSLEPDSPIGAELGLGAAGRMVTQEEAQRAVAEAMASRPVATGAEIAKAAAAAAAPAPAESVEKDAGAGTGEPTAAAKPKRAKKASTAKKSTKKPSDPA